MQNKIELQEILKVSSVAWNNIVAIQSGTVHKTVPVTKLKSEI